MSKRKVTFIVCPVPNSASDRNFIELSKVIDTNQPLKDVAINILNSLKRPKINLGLMNTHLMIEPLPNNVNIKKFIDNDSSFGIKTSVL